MAPVTHPMTEYFLEGEQYASKNLRKASLDTLKHDLNDRLARALPTNVQPYAAVNVLLLSWEQNDSNNHLDCNDFRNFLEQEYGYDCVEYQIIGGPLDREISDLLNVLADLARKSTAQSLTIIYYSGHGYSNSQVSGRTVEKNLVIFPTTSGIAPHDLESKDFGISYGTVSGILGTARGAVLHILECCSGGGAAISQNHEQLSASCTMNPSCRKTIQPFGLFTRVLIQTMTDLKKEHGYFTVAELHARMIIDGPKSQHPPPAIQPWYSMGLSRKAITLIPLTEQVQPTPRLKDPKTCEENVLLRITVDANKIEVEDFLGNWPTISSDRTTNPASYIRILGYLPSRDVVILFLVMPISLWHALPENEAYEFEAFVESEIELPFLLPSPTT